VVYGTMTDESALDEALINRFDYDEVFGTVLNRFCAQAAVGHPAHRLRQGRANPRLSGYSRHRPLHRAGLPESGGEGRMPRLQPVHRAVLGAGTGSPGAGGGPEAESEVEIDHLPDPRVEAEEHYYNARHSKLVELGLKPHLLSESLLDSLLNIAIRYSDRIDQSLFLPRVNWREPVNRRQQDKEKLILAAGVLEP
jgi:UDP-sulfoquinovose synthase